VSAPDTPWNDPTPDPAHPDGPPVDDPERGMDEDCADGLHRYCLTEACVCACHQEVA
jgi:hypothetical protein